MSDAEATRREWARRVTEAYEGWPRWLTPGAPLPEDPGAGERARVAKTRTPADAPAGHPSSGWSWGLMPAEVEDVDRQLGLERRRGEAARAIRAERAYWGLGREDD